MDEMNEALNQLDDKLNLTAGEDDIKGIYMFVFKIGLKKTQNKSITSS